VNARNDTAARAVTIFDMCLAPLYRRELSAIRSEIRLTQVDLEIEAKWIKDAALVAASVSFVSA
jgi:hypothetical protein